MTTEKEDCTKFDDVWAMGRIKAVMGHLNERQKQSVMAWLKARYFPEG
jgi:hypothetical protein